MDLKSHVVLPESYFIGADVSYDFVSLNDMHHFVDQKYKTRDEIAAEAEVSRSTLFRYFGTKESLVFPNQEDRLEMFRRLLADERDDESPFDVVRRAIIELAGVKVGKVSAIELDGGDYEAVVHLDISKQVRLTDDSIASIRTAGIIGDRFIKLTPGGSEIYLEPGDEIEVQGQKFRVAGILEPATQFVDGIVMMDLATAQGVFNRPAAVSAAYVTRFVQVVPPSREMSTSQISPAVSSCFGTSAR